MKKRFDVDEENKIVDIDLYCDKADDFLQSNLDTKVPTFDREKFGKIKELISDFPSDYRADLNIKVADYQDYKPEEILGGLAAMSAFVGKGGRIYKMAMQFGIVIFLLDALILMYAIALKTKIFTAVVGLLIAVAYLFGIIVLKITREKLVNKKK